MFRVRNGIMLQRIVFHDLFIVVLCMFFASVVEAKQQPNWVNNPIAGCEKGFVCAVGDGENALSASANARSELAKQISVSINSNASFAVSQNGNKDYTSATFSVNEEVNEMLSGVTITELYQDGKNYYAFAIFDKQKMENQLLAEIDNLDKGIQQNLQTKPVPVKTTKKLIQMRAKKNQKYMGLTGKSIDTKFSIHDIRKAKGQPNVYKVDLIKNDVLNLKNFLRGEIIDNFDTLANNSNKVITGEVKMEKQYLNVDGFEKYDITVILKCKENNDNIGSIQIVKSGTGRNKQQIVDNTKKVILEEIANQIDGLLR